MKISKGIWLALVPLASLGYIIMCALELQRKHIEAWGHIPEIMIPFSVSHAYDVAWKSYLVLIVILLLTFAFLVVWGLDE